MNDGRLAQYCHTLVQVEVRLGGIIPIIIKPVWVLLRFFRHRLLALFKLKLWLVSYLITVSYPVLKFSHV